MGSLTAEETEKVRGSEDELVKLVKDKVKQWMDWSGDWVAEARQAYGFVAGDQWTDDERSAMEAQGRVPIVMNRLAAFVRGVCGLEASNRQEVRYTPREQGDVAPSEVINAAAKWVRDGCNAEDEESDAFRDMIICGMGWTETRLSYDEDPEGQCLIDRRDPLKCAWDTAATKRGLADASWVAQWQDYTKAEFEATWPDKFEEVGAAMWPDDSGFGEVHNQDKAKWYSNTAISAPAKDHVRVVQFQYWKTKVSYRVEDFNGQVIEMEADKFKRVLPFVQQRGLKFAKMIKREYRQCFIAGDTLLEDVALPGSGFTLKAMTGIRDRNAGCWYGLVRDGIDPQKWANKFFSLQIDIMSTSSKGGLMAENNAFEDRAKAEEDWANPRSIIWTQPGALQEGKVQPRPQQMIPPQINQMMSMAIESLPQILGINLEFLGMANRAQAGILEQQRKQSAITTLAEFFSSLRLYRQQQGKVLLEIINNFLSDGRLVRIVGQTGEQYVPLTRQPDFMKYDVIVDEAPASPDVRGRAWMALSEMMPAMMKMGAPIPPEVLDYAPIPSSLSAKWKQMLNQASQQPQLPPEHMRAMQQMQEQAQKLAQENQQLKMDRSLKQMDLQAQREEAMQKLQLQQMEATETLKLKRDIAEYDAQLKMLEANSAAELQNQKIMAEIEAKFEVLRADAKYRDMERERTESSEIRANESGLGEIKKAIADIAGSIAEIRSVEQREEKAGEPKAIQMIYSKNGSLTEAVLTKDDGKTVRVKVGRTNKGKGE